GAQVAVPLELAAHGDALRGRVAPSARDRLFMDVVDATDLDAMIGFADAVARRYGRVDILVAIVGGFAGGALIETDRATWDRMLAVVDARGLEAIMGFAGTDARRYGRVAILVAIVGGCAGGALIDTDRATWDRMLARSPTATFAAVRFMASIRSHVARSVSIS